MAGGYLLVDHEDGMLATLTVWEDRNAVEASRMRAGRLRQEAAREAGGGVASVDEFEIAIDFSTQAGALAVAPSTLFHPGLLGGWGCQKPPSPKEDTE